MSTMHVHWRRAIAAAVVAEALLVMAAVCWVAFYSYVIRPGQPVAVYQQHASAAGPWVSIVTGVFVFLALGRWWVRSLPTAMAWIVLHITGDAAILWAASGASAALPWGLVAASYSTKALCGLLGARFAERTQETTPA